MNNTLSKKEKKKCIILQVNMNYSIMVRRSTVFNYKKKKVSNYHG